MAPLDLSRRAFSPSRPPLGGLIAAAPLLGPCAGRPGASAHPRDDRPALHVFPTTIMPTSRTTRWAWRARPRIIDAIRAEATNTLLLDNGDFLQGNPMGDYIAYERGMKAGDVHPVIKGMNMLGFDADARQPRVQLRPRLHRPASSPARTSRSSAPTSPTDARRQPARRRALPEALRHPRPHVIDGAGDDAPDPGRPHRLRAAADHAVGPRASRGQGRGPRHRRGGAGLGAGDAGGRRRHRHRALPFRHRRRAGGGDAGECLALLAASRASTPS